MRKRFDGRTRSKAEVNAMNSVMNEHLASFFSINVRRKDGEWQPMNLLLDTGFNGEVEINADLLAKHDLATKPDHQLLTPDEVLMNSNIWDPKKPYEGTIEWGGRDRTAGIRPALGLGIEGMLGTRLLKWQRLTVDVIEGGAVTIESIPPCPSRSIFPWRSRRTNKPKPLRGDLEEFTIFWGSYLPLTEIQVQDSEGQLNSILVNVDTGNNQELNLPFRKVDSLGLTATGKCRMNTSDGLVEREQGEAEIIWMGKKRRVRCVHWPDDKPPHIGMKLLEGTRLTVDFDLDMPIAEIRGIRRPAPSVRGFLDALGGHFK